MPEDIECDCGSMVAEVVEFDKVIIHFEDCALIQDKKKRLVDW